MMRETTMETFCIINQIPKINRAHWNLPWMSCILKFRSLKISLETLERSFHRREKTEISREASWGMYMKFPPFDYPTNGKFQMCMCSSEVVYVEKVVCWELWSFEHNLDLFFRNYLNAKSQLGTSSFILAELSSDCLALVTINWR